MLFRSFLLLDDSKHITPITSLLYNIGISTIDLILFDFMYESITHFFLSLLFISLTINISSLSDSKYFLQSSYLNDLPLLYSSVFLQYRLSQLIFDFFSSYIHIETLSTSKDSLTFLIRFFDPFIISPENKILSFVWFVIKLFRLFI